MSSRHCHTDIPALLADKDFRNGIVTRLENDVVKDFWLNEYAKYSHAFRAVVIAPLQNKVGALLTHLDRDIPRTFRAVVVKVYEWIAAQNEAKKRTAVIALETERRNAA